MATRIDKYLWCVRLAKTRSQAAELIAKGKVRLNGDPCKASKEVKPGDEIEVHRHSAIFRYCVKSLLDRRVGAALVAEYIADKTTPEELEKFRIYKLNQQEYRAQGDGKPNKKQRRNLDDFLENW